MARKKSKITDADPYREREQLKYEHPIPSREFILRKLNESAGPMTREQLADLLDLTGEDDREALRRRLRAMERDGQLICNRRGGYVRVDESELVRGRVMGHQDGWGYLISDVGRRRIFLSPRQMRSLLNGDRAVVRITDIDNQGRPEGEVVEVLQRGNSQIVGRFYVESGVGFVVPDNKRLHQDVIVPGDGWAGAEHGQLVVVEVLEQPSARRQAIGRIRDVIGEHVTAGQAIDVAAKVYGIPTEWPADVTTEIGGLEPTVPEEAKADRVDLRDTPLVTIDGPDARDFDDAVFCEATPKGFRLLVAIADVGHYVGLDTSLDREARERGNSVYFPDAVVPMLPEVLSNNLCSLNPAVDRLCMVCEMLVDREGNLRRSRFFEGVMRSAARLTYDEVAGILVERDPEPRAKRAELTPHLENLYKVFKALDQARRRRGAIDFDTTETKIVFDARGGIDQIVPLQRNDAHRLIEECMVLANVAAARFITRHRIVGLYRDHEGPTAEKLDNLRQFLNEIGVHLGGGAKPSSQDYARVIERIAERPDRHLIQTVMLRSLSAADYRPENIGHFGLALAAYAHFTSPIRRYPDLVVHRAIRHILRGGSGKDYETGTDDMVALGEHCSMTERRADEATRDAITTLKCQYMSDKLGEEFDGVISGVTSFGLFVELDGIYVDGLVHVTNLEHDYFHFDPVGHRLTGQRTGIEYRLVDRVKVRVARVDVDDRKIDFELLSHAGGARPGRKASGGRSRSKTGSRAAPGKGRTRRGAAGRTRRK